MEPEPKPFTETKEGDRLQTKYYCKVDKSQHMKVVMELKTKKHAIQERFSLRYVLVIDVSHSMQQVVGRDRRTLLQRVQLFAELAVRKMRQNDFLSIVTFSDDSKIILPMMRMTNVNKLHVKNILKQLSTEGNTNLESGLMGALASIQSAPQMHRASRDCIILFTDGEANQGETIPENLIANYIRMHANLNKKSCVPVSAFTMGGYHPDLLIEISRKLGSESFYWLNDEEDFEADMLIPLFLREITNVSDVNIKLETRMQSYFDPVDYDAQHLKKVEKHTVKIRKNKKKKKATSLLYFIHSLPDETTKNLNFQVVIPQFQELDGVKIVDVTIQFLDEDMEPRTIQDYILLNTTSMAVMVSQNRLTASSLNVVSLSASFTEISAYIMKNNQASITQREAEEVILKVAEEECKMVGVSSITSAKHAEDNTGQIHACFQQASIEVNRIRNSSEILLADGSEAAAQLKRIATDWTSRINNANDTVASKDARNYSLLSSMAASIMTESPTSGGIFKGKQPFMSQGLENQLKEEKQNLEVARRIQSNSHIDIHTLKRLVKTATDAGQLDKMKEYLRDLRGLELFEYEVEEEYIRYVADEIQHRIKIETIKSKLQSTLSDQDVSGTEILVAKMKALREDHKLTFAPTDHDSLKTTSNNLSILKRKRGLRGEIANSMQVLQLPLIPKNLLLVSNAIEKLVRLRNESRGLDDVFTDRDNTILNMTITKTAQAQKEIVRLKHKIDELNIVLKTSQTPEKLELLKQTVAEMEFVKSEAKIYTGLFTENDAKVLKRALDNLDSLEKNHHELKEKIQHLMPNLELPMLPRNYAMITEALEEMVTTKERAVHFNNLFTSGNETALNQAAENSILLKTKMHELGDTILSCLCDIGLSTFPANLEKLAVAVEKMTEARNEAAGFNEVFTDEHTGKLQSGTATLRILRAQKQETQNELNQCLLKLQLPMLPENYEKICEGVKTMTGVSSIVKEFGLYQDGYDALLDKATFNRDVLKDKRQQIERDLVRLNPSLELAPVPDNLMRMREAAERMKSLKEASNGFENLFTPDHEKKLFQVMTNLKHLNNKLDKLGKAREKLESAVGNKSYESLKHAVKKANKTTFFDKDELKEPRKLLTFLNPKTRRSAVRNAMEQGDAVLLEEALLNMREAAVNDDELEDKARGTLLVLHRQKRREEKERRRITREKKKREKQMKKLQDDLSDAIDSINIENLEQALNEFENCGFSETEIPIAIEARELLEHLKIEKMRNRLQEGIRKRDFEILLDALIDADYGRFQEHMQKEYDEAKELILYLQEMMRLRDTIVKMTRSSISEIHKYPSPPQTVKRVMVSLFIILGETPKSLKNWLYIQALMGRLDRSSITKRVLRFKLSDLSLHVAKVADSFLKDFNLQDVEDNSATAATFYAWAKYVINEVNYSEKEAKKKQHEIDEAENDDSGHYERENFESDHDETGSETLAGEEENNSHSEHEENVDGTENNASDIDA